MPRKRRTAHEMLQQKAGGTARGDAPKAIEPTALYTTADLPAVLHLGRPTIRAAIKSGELRCTVKGNRHLFLGEWLLDYLRGVPSD